MEALVRRGLFDTIEIGFLPVADTHCDINQAFSTTSELLRTHDAIALDDIHNVLSCCYNDHTLRLAVGTDKLAWAVR